jgi:hypothetical protein
LTSLTLSPLHYCTNPPFLSINSSPNSIPHFSSPLPSVRSYSHLFLLHKISTLFLFLPFHLPCRKTELANLHNLTSVHHSTTSSDISPLRRATKPDLLELGQSPCCSCIDAPFCLLPTAPLLHNQIIKFIALSQADFMGVVVEKPGLAPHNTIEHDSLTPLLPWDKNLVISFLLFLPTMRVVCRAVPVP